MAFALFLSTRNSALGRVWPPTAGGTAGLDASSLLGGRPPTAGGARGADATTAAGRWPPTAASTAGASGIEATSSAADSGDDGDIVPNVKSVRAIDLAAADVSRPPVV